MGKGRHDGDRGKKHRLCLRRSLWSHDPQGDPGPWALALRGGEDTVRESKPAPKKGKTNYPHPTSTLCPPPPLPTGTLPGGRENHRPTPPLLSLASSQQKEGGGPSACHQPHTPDRWGLPHPEKVPESFPKVRCPQPPIHGIPHSHSPRGKARSWLSHEDGRKNQRCEGSNLSSATLGDLRQVT